MRLPHRDLISPRPPPIPTRDQLRRRPQRIILRRRRQLIILIRNKTHHQRPGHIQHLRRPSTRVRARGHVNCPPGPPRLPIVRRRDRANTKRAHSGGLEHGDQRIPADGRYAGHAVPRGETRARYRLGGGPGGAAVGREALQRVLVVGRGLVRVVQLQRGSVERVPQEGLPEPCHGAWVCGGLAEEVPAFAEVVGVADGDAEVDVAAAVLRVFGVVAEGDEEPAGGELDDVGVVDVVGVGRAAGDVALDFPGCGGLVCGEWSVL